MLRNKFNKLNPFARTKTPGSLPKPLPANTDQRLVQVYVEGYEDVAFWRGIFDHFTNPHLRFEISVPTREDLPKGKKVLMSMIPDSCEDMLLCVDSDFDFLFADHTEQSREVNNARFMFHTYAYATENYLCYAPSLHNVCVRATKNDTRIFDFVRFMHEYSCTIYPLFVWYAFSAARGSANIFPLVDFKSAVRIGYLDLEDNGTNTLAWLGRNVAKRQHLLEGRHPGLMAEMNKFESHMVARGLSPENTYLFMHGHTLMDNVVLILVNTVCDKLREISMNNIRASKKQGVALRNEVSNYQNSLRAAREVLLDNENYTSCPLYKQLKSDIEKYLSHTIHDIKAGGLLK